MNVAASIMNRRTRRRLQSLLALSLCGALTVGNLRPARATATAEAIVPPQRPAGVSAAIERSIENGLQHLADSQGADGSWRSGGMGSAFPTAITALAGLAFLSSGSTPTEGPYARNVSRAVTSLLNSARPDGLIARLEEESHNMHGHGFAILFLAQCFGMEEDPRRQAEIKGVLQRAIELTARSQSALGGWLYTPDANADEGSVTVTQVQALRACRNAGLAVPKQVIDEAMLYLDRSSNPDGGIRYQAGRGGPSRAPLTAAAIVCWYNAGIYEDPRVDKALAFVERTLMPGRSRAGGHYFYAQLYMAQAMYLTGDEKWRPYYRDIARDLLTRQSSNGAWDGDSVGTNYGTAMALLILQMPYKHLPIMQR
jgi:hypothetical protein